MTLKAFIYQNELHIRTIPAKNLFHSTMVHEVVNRGDIFALRVKDQMLTIVPGTAKVDHVEVHPMVMYKHGESEGTSINEF